MKLKEDELLLKVYLNVKRRGIEAINFLQKVGKTEIKTVYNWDLYSNIPTRQEGDLSDNNIEHPMKLYHRAS